MQIRQYLNDDGQVALALCSAFALRQDEPQPLHLAEWNQLARQIHNSSWKRPGALPGRSARELALELSLPFSHAERIFRLLDRSARLPLELDSLFARGIWAVSRMDERYPARLRRILKHQAQVVLFGAGEIGLLNSPGLAVVGSRNIDEAGVAFAKEVGRKAVAAGLTVISGGARGADRVAMNSAIQAGGIAIGALAESLEGTLRKRDVEQLVSERQLVLLTPQIPSAGFSVGGAMTRNKIIYALAESAVIVSSEFKNGGTWAGAMEALKGNWCPVFARDGAEAPRGNRELLKLGAAPLPQSALETSEDLRSWICLHARSKPAEPDLFL